MTIINYAAKLDELPVGTVIRNGPVDAPAYFVQIDTGGWWPCTPSGRRELPTRIEDNVPRGGFSSARVFLPAEVVTPNAGVFADASNIIRTEIAAFLTADSTLIADSITRRLAGADLLRGTR